MKGSCNAIDTNTDSARHLIAANKGGAVATGAGPCLDTSRPAVVYVQNSRLGNANNPPSSLTSRRVYGIPMVLLIGWRGEPGVHDDPQREHQGAITREQLDLLDIPTTVLGPDDDASVFVDAYEQAKEARSPVALLVRRGTITPPPAGEWSTGLARIDAIQQVVDTLPRETAYVAATGFTLGLLLELNHRPDHSSGVDERGDEQVRESISLICDALGVSDAHEARDWLAGLIVRLGLESSVDEASGRPVDRSRWLAGVNAQRSVNNPDRLSHADLMEITKAA